MNYTSLAIVLPCFNPLDGWVDNVSVHFDEISKKLSSIAIKLVIVNDGSVKNFSAAQIEELLPNAILVNYSKNKGKGFALRKGMAAIEADIYIYTDIDFPYVNDFFLNIAQSLLEGKADLVSGKKDTNYYENVPWFRKIISQQLQWMTRTVFGLPTSDTQCGLKGFNNRGKAVFLQTTINRYLFDLEFLILAKKNGLKMIFEKVDLRPGVQFSKVGIGLLSKEIFNFIRLIFHR